MNKETKGSVALLNQEVTRQLADPSVVRALLATTFKGLTEQTMRQAALEGVIRGYTFKDFLEKNVYAIPYGNGYSLVSSIDYARKIGMRSGVIGKSAPTFEMDGSNIVACSITIKRRVGKDIGEYTATVYLEEFSTGKNLWATKPRVMLAKTAEMHALRMACPEEMSQVYTEEEFDKEKEEVYDTEGIDDNTIPSIHIGSSENEIMPNMTIDKKPKADDFEMPQTELEQKNLIKALILKKWPTLDTKDAKAVKTQIADYTELEYVPQNYKTIINYLR